MAARDDCINLLVVGTVGTGKSSTGNKILQLKRDPFQNGDTDCSSTTECRADFSKYGNQVIKVVDMPGLNNATIKEDAEKQVVEAAMNALASTPHGYDAFLIVIKHGKQDKVTEVTNHQLKKIFGDRIIEQYGVLVVTHGEDFLRNRSGYTRDAYKEYCSQQRGIINKLWEECQERVVLFDNSTKNAEMLRRQRQDLLYIVERMRSTERYTPDLFKAAQKSYDTMVKQAKEQDFNQSVIKRIRLIMHDLEDTDVEDATESEMKLLLLKSKVEDQLENFSYMQKTSLNAEDRVFLESLKKAIGMKQELVKMTKKYHQADAADGKQGTGELRMKIDEMKKEMEKKESDLDMKYWSFSMRNTTKIKLKESLTSSFLGMFSRRK